MPDHEHEGMDWLFELQDDETMDEELRATREAFKHERAPSVISIAPFFVYRQFAHTRCW